MCKIFKEENINVQLEEIGTEAIRGCIAYINCKNTGKCITDGIVNRLALAFKAANRLVVGSPVYYASANASLIALLDRLFLKYKI